ncbi:helix-turn-helix domain-containing protein [Megamonas hypermegale]
MLKIPKNTICYLSRNRELKGAKLERQWRIYKKQLKIFIEDNTTK